MAQHVEGWATIRHRTNTIATDCEEPVEAATLKNALEFLALAETITPVPTEVARGLWPTIRIIWDGFEFEIFESSIEFYRFMDGSTDIHEYDRSPGASFEAGLIADLRSIAAERSR